MADGGTPFLTGLVGGLAEGSKETRQREDVTRGTLAQLIASSRLSEMEHERAARLQRRQSLFNLRATLGAQNARMNPLERLLQGELRAAPDGTIFRQPASPEQAYKFAARFRGIVEGARAGLQGGPPPVIAPAAAGAGAPPVEETFPSAGAPLGAKAPGDMDREVEPPAMGEGPREWTEADVRTISSLWGVEPEEAWAMVDPQGYERRRALQRIPALQAAISEGLADVDPAVRAGLISKLTKIVLEQSGAPITEELERELETSRALAGAGAAGRERGAETVIGGQAIAKVVSDLGPAYPKIGSDLAGAISRRQQEIEGAGGEFTAADLGNALAAAIPEVVDTKNDWKEVARLSRNLPVLIRTATGLKGAALDAATRETYRALVRGATEVSKEGLGFWEALGGAIGEPMAYQQLDAMQSIFQEAKAAGVEVDWTPTPAFVQKVLEAKAVDRLLDIRDEFGLRWPAQVLDPIRRAGFKARL